MSNYYSSCKDNLSLASPPLIAGYRATHWLGFKQFNQNMITWYQRAKQRRQLAQLDDPNAERHRRNRDAGPV